MCTYISKMCANNSCLVGRTMEFSYELNSYPVFIPAGAEITRYAQSGVYNSNYASVGMTAYERPIAVDGLNEHGLNVATLYFSGVAQYSDTVDENSYYPYEFNQLLLSQCKSVDDVISFLTENSGINVVDDPDDPMGLHWPVTDAMGKSIVIEPINGKLVITDNPVGVCTNSPELSWHLTNLANYVNMSTEGQNSYVFNSDFTASINGAGSGLTGIPGDWTPASRFVRAAYFTQMLPVPESAGSGVTDIFHILSTSDIVKGCVISHSDTGDEYMETTPYTTCCDLMNLYYYYHTYENRAITYLSLNSLISTYQETTAFNFPKKQALTDGTLI